MGRSERKATYQLLGLFGALVMGALLVVVLTGPMAAAQPNQRGDDNKVAQRTVRVSAAGNNNPMVYKSVDSRGDFKGGHYSHVLRCPDGYKAIGGGFDLNTPDPKVLRIRPDWTILASYPSNSSDGRRGETWTVDAYGFRQGAFGSLSKFTAYAACAPKELLPQLRYESNSTTLGKNETRTIRATCAKDDRVIGGSFRLGSRDMDLVRSERSREDERSWVSGATFSRPDTTDNAATIQSWAVCVSRGALEATRYLEATDTSTKRAVANTPSCSEGTYLLSEGAGVPDDAYKYPSDAWWSNSSPPNEGAQSWKASADQAREGSLKVHAFALCGRFADGGGGSGDGGRADSPDKPGEREN